jgi:hypothetical protein
MLGTSGTEAKLPVPSKMAHFMHYVLDSLDKYAKEGRPVFKRLSGEPGPPSWNTVTYAQFLRDLQRTAAYWLKVLGEQDIRPLSVIGVWYVYSSYISSHLNATV